ncbi:MAG: hypothetical protein H6601_04000 [Flavobacteriales bacterium]|nr:hypothetical protein [Flavobacteriales bacterium]MCB9185888.1 hypothetical protein [Flavobacteriales bacterium]
MQSTENKKELVLEVVKDGYRRLVFRQEIGNGSYLFLEESDLVDFSRPLSESNDFNVFFTERSFWKSFIEYTSNEGLLKRQVWHQKTNEWLDLKPLFIHNDIKHLIQNSLSDIIRNHSSSRTDELEGVRIWLRALSSNGSTIKIDQPHNTLRHAV